MRKNTIGYIAIIVMLAVSSVFSINLYFKEKTAHDKINIASFPMVIDGWKGRDLPITDRDYDILETKNLISREYANSKGEKLFLFVIYSETNRSVFHPPDVCLMGSGLAIVNKKTDSIAYDKDEKFSTNKLYLEKGDHKEITLYSYKAGNFYTENFYLQQMYLILHQALGRRIPGATIRVSMAYTGDEAAAVSDLKEFLGKTAEMVDSLSRP